MAGRRADIPESELHKLIHYGCLFELELHQAVEMDALRAESRKMRATLKQRRKRARRKARRDARRND